MKKHRKIQKKQETELHVQVAEKPENQKENVGEALACFCIYVGSYGDAVLQGISGDDSFWQCGSDSTCDGRSCKWTKRKEIHTENRA